MIHVLQVVAAVAGVIIAVVACGFSLTRPRDDETAFIESGRSHLRNTSEKGR